MNVRASGAVLSEADKSAMRAVVDSGWITAGPVNAKFEQRLSEFTGIKHVRTCNSGSSANLLAVASMVESGRWKAKDLIVTVAAGFPTTINPLLLYGLTPMFIDVDLDTLNVNMDQLYRALNAHHVKGVILAHTLGNPYDAAKVAEICRKRGLWLIEDCCDALGATFHGKHVGGFGAISTCSFFPAHHITSLDADELVLLRSPAGEIQFLPIGPFVDARNYSGWECVAFDMDGKLSFKNITGIVKHKCDEPLLRIKLENGRSALVTASHSVFVLRNGFADAIRTDALKVGEYVLAPRVLPTNARRKKVPYSAYKRGSWKKIAKRIAIDEKLCRILGWFVAEGSLCLTPRGNYNVQFSLGAHEADVAKVLTRDIAKVFGVKMRSYVRDSTLTLLGSNKGLYEFLAYQCRTGAANKRVPPFMFEVSKDMQRVFVGSYLAGDGHHREHKEHEAWEAKTVSRELAHGIQAILLQLEMSPRFYTTKPGSRTFPAGYKSPTKKIYTVGYGTSGNGRANAKSFRDGVGGKRRFGDLVQLKIVSIEEVTPSTEYVYDLSVAGYENFVAGSGMVVHNTGEGGAVFTNDEELAAIASSIRDWGRDCFCIPGDNNTCGKRFSQQFGSLPYGYDHKYVISNLGYNLKLTDIQAACGLSQMDRLPEFISARRDNFDFLAERFDSLPVKLVDEILGARASWFGFPFTLNETGIRVELQSYLAEKGVDSRLVFAGNIVKQPYFAKQKYLLAAAMTNTDRVMNDTLWLGCHPALTKEQLDYAYSCVKDFLSL